MSDLTYRPDVESPAWDAFVASLDPVRLEAERMRAPKLSERFGSQEHHRMVHAHKLRRLEVRRLESFRVVPLRAVMPVGGPVSQSDGLTGSNSSTRSTGVAGAAESKISSTDRKAA